MSTFQIYAGDCAERLKELPENSIDSIVTDPPYGLNFMGKKWDCSVPPVHIWQECLRVLKPGGHLIAFAGTRTQHRMAVNIEDAGFEIRDMIAWIYASGFPKSHDVSKAIDKAAGAERGVVGSRTLHGRAAQSTKEKGGTYTSGAPSSAGMSKEVDITAPATDAARQWQGWGTALKPALEPITVARKPFIGTVAENVLAHGTGALNINGCRVGTDGGTKDAPNGTGNKQNEVFGVYAACNKERVKGLGRWPANLIHDGSEEVTALAGSVARFFYCAKASKRDRDEGIFNETPLPSAASQFRPNHTEKAEQGETGNPYGRWKPQANNHPTVKPTDVMRYLCRLVTPPNGVVLDPFMGSGSTGKAAMLEGLQFIGVEMDEQYIEIAKARILYAISNLSNSTPLQTDMFNG